MNLNTVISRRADRQHYRQSLSEAREHIAYCRRTYGGPIIFLSHPIGGSTQAEETANMIRMGTLIQSISMFTNSMCFNQLPFHARFKADDPRNFHQKFEVFYRGAIKETDVFVVAPGFEKARGCQTEFEIAQEFGKKIYQLNEEFIEEFGPEGELVAANEDELKSFLDFNFIRTHNFRTMFKGSIDWQTIVTAL